MSRLKGIGANDATLLTHAGPWPDRPRALETDRRIFTPTPHGKPRHQGPLGRPSGSTAASTGVEAHFIRGIARMTLQVDLALVVMMALALVGAG